MKRTGLTGLALALGSFASAQTGLVGTKVSNAVPVTTSTTGTGVGVGALIQMLIALAIVGFLLKWVLPKLAGKFTGKGFGKTTNGIKLEETVQIPGGSLHVVSVRGRTFLVGSTAQAISQLADLTERQAPEIDPFEIALGQAKPFDATSLETAPLEVVSNPNLEALAQLDRLAQIANPAFAEEQVVGGHGLR